MNEKEKRELTRSKIALLILAIIGLAAAIWFAWIRPSEHNPDVIQSFQACADAGNAIQESYPEVCVTNDGRTFVNPKQKNAQSDIGQSEQEDRYLTVAEWGIQIPLTDATADMTYVYSKRGSDEYVSFTFKRLQNAGVCITDAGVTLTRSTSENAPPYTVDNPEVFKNVGSYYYYAAFANGDPCYDATDAAQTGIVTQIAGNETLRTAIVDRLAALRSLQ